MTAEAQMVFDFGVQLRQLGQGWCLTVVCLAVVLEVGFRHLYRAFECLKLAFGDYVLNTCTGARRLRVWHVRWTLA